MDVREVFAHNVRKERKKQGYSQEKLGELSGLHRTYISQVERAEKNSTLETANLIAEALDVPLSNLVMEDDENDYE